MHDIVTNFHFVRPYLLLLLIPLLFVLAIYARRRLQSGGWNKVCDEKLLPFVLMGQQQQNSLWSLLGIGMGGLIAIVALAGPAWEKLPQPIFSSKAALVIALDLSHSMDVTDIKPSRLVRARHKILDILHKRHEGQTALIVYAAEAFVVTPLTDDTNTVASLVKDLETSLMPSQGSYPEKAIKSAMQLFKQSSIVNGQVLLVTDGIDSPGMDDAVKQLTDAGYRLSILGVGTEQGAPIADYRGGFVKDKTGAIVVARLDPMRTAQMALRGHGIYRTITPDDRDVDDLVSIFSASRISGKYTQQKDELKVHSDQWREEGPWLLLLLLPFTALAFRRGYLVLVFALILLPLPQTSMAFEWSSLWKNSDQRARQALQAGDNKTAASLFKDPEWKAAANFRAGNYQQSVEALKDEQTPDALYNKATAMAKLGNIQQAIDTYDQVLKLDPKNADAKYNRGVLQDYLKQQQQQQSKQDKSGKDDSKQNNSQQGDSQQDNSQQKKDQQEKSSQNDDKSQDAKGDQSQDQQQKQGDARDNSSQSSAEGKQQSDQQRQQQNAQQDSAKNQEDTDHKHKAGQDQAQQQQNDKQDSKSLAQSKQDSEQNKQDIQQLQQEMEKQRGKQDNAQQNEDSNGKPKQLAGQLQEDETRLENLQKTEQWLRRIPDDPGGLLRRKFSMQSQLNARQAQSESKPW